MRCTAVYRICVCVVAIALLLLGPRPASALAITDSNIGFGNLSITAAAGDLLFSDPWTAMAFAEAANSLGERVQDFDQSIGGNAEAEASVEFAAAVGLASAPNVTGSGNSAARIPVCDPLAASSVGRGSVVNSFIVTGGDGPVTVDFAVDVVGLQRLRTDECGVLASSEIIFALLVDGTPVLFEQSFITIGPNAAADLRFFKQLTASAVLIYNTSYSIFVGADAESRSITDVAEPTTVSLVCIAVAALLVRGRAAQRPTHRP